VYSSKKIKAKKKAGLSYYDVQFYIQCLVQKWPTKFFSDCFQA